MAEPFMGQIMQVGFSYAPRGWSTCSGQLLAITQNTALFSLIGTTFGGNGQQTFGLPDARSRLFVGTGQGPGLSPYSVGQIGGVEQQTILSTQMPVHSHAATFTPTGGGATGTLTAKTGVPSGSQTSIPADGSFLANTEDPVSGSAVNIYAPANAGGTPVNLGGLDISGTGGGGTVQVAPAGGSQPLPVMQPYLAVTTIIAVEGIYPPRN